MFRLFTRLFTRAETADSEQGFIHGSSRPLRRAGKIPGGRLSAQQHRRRSGELHKGQSIRSRFQHMRPVAPQTQLQRRPLSRRQRTDGGFSGRIPPGPDGFQRGGQTLPRFRAKEKRRNRGEILLPLGYGIPRYVRRRSRRGRDQVTACPAGGRKIDACRGGSVPRRAEARSS